MGIGRGKIYEILSESRFSLGKPSKIEMKPLDSFPFPGGGWNVSLRGLEILGKPSFMSPMRRFIGSNELFGQLAIGIYQHAIWTMVLIERLVIGKGSNWSIAS